MRGGDTAGFLGMARAASGFSASAGLTARPGARAGGSVAIRGRRELGLRTAPGTAVQEPRPGLWLVSAGTTQTRHPGRTGGLGGSQDPGVERGSLPTAQETADAPAHAAIGLAEAEEAVTRLHSCVQTRV